MEKLEEKANTTAKSIRLIILGNSMAGKTSIILRYTDNTFANNFAPTLGKIITAKF